MARRSNTTRLPVILWASLLGPSYHLCTVTSTKTQNDTPIDGNETRQEERRVASDFSDISILIQVATRIRLSLPEADWTSADTIERSASNYADQLNRVLYREATNDSARTVGRKCLIRLFGAADAAARHSVQLDNSLCEAIDQAGPDQEAAFDRVKELLHLGANPLGQHSLWDSKTPLQVAAAGANPRILEYLLHKGCALAVNATDPYGLTALDFALDARRRIQDPGLRDNILNNIILLLKAGADPGRKRANGNTAVHEAVRSGDADALQRLISQDRKRLLSLTNALGYTPSELAWHMLTSNYQRFARVLSVLGEEVAAKANATVHHRLPLVVAHLLGPQVAPSLQGSLEDQLRAVASVAESYPYWVAATAEQYGASTPAFLRKHSPLLAAISSPGDLSAIRVEVTDKLGASVGKVCKEAIDEYLVRIKAGESDPYGLLPLAADKEGLAAKIEGILGKGEGAAFMQAVGAGPTSESTRGIYEWALRLSLPQLRNVNAARLPGSTVPFDQYMNKLVASAAKAMESSSTKEITDEIIAAQDQLRNDLTEAANDLTREILGAQAQLLAAPEDSELAKSISKELTARLTQDVFGDNNLASFADQGIEVFWKAAQSDFDGEDFAKKGGLYTAFELGDQFNSYVDRRLDLWNDTIGAAGVFRKYRNPATAAFQMAADLGLLSQQDLDKIKGPWHEAEKAAACVLAGDYMSAQKYGVGLIGSLFGSGAPEGPSPEQAFIEKGFAEVQKGQEFILENQKRTFDLITQLGKYYDSRFNELQAGQATIFEGITGIFNELRAQARFLQELGELQKSQGEAQVAIYKSQSKQLQDLASIVLTVAAVTREDRLNHIFQCRDTFKNKDLGKRFRTVDYDKMAGPMGAFANSLTVADRDAMAKLIIELNALKSNPVPALLRAGEERSSESGRLQWDAAYKKMWAGQKAVLGDGLFFDYSQLTPATCQEAETIWRQSRRTEKGGALSPDRIRLLGNDGSGSKDGGTVTSLLLDGNFLVDTEVLALLSEAAIVYIPYYLATNGQSFLPERKAYEDALQLQFIREKRGEANSWLQGLIHIADVGIAQRGLVAGGVWLPWILRNVASAEVREALGACPLLKRNLIAYLLFLDDEGLRPAGEIRVAEEGEDGKKGTGLTRISWSDPAVGVELVTRESYSSLRKGNFYYPEEVERLRAIRDELVGMVVRLEADDYVDSVEVVGGEALATSAYAALARN